MKLEFLATGLCLACGIALFSSCSPQAFTMNVEMRYPSTSGLSLDGKSIAVVYLDSDSQKDSVFNEYLANGFASSIEKDYFDGKPSVNLFRISKQDDVDYTCKDSLQSLVMQTGDDIVFLFDAPEFGNVAVSELQKPSGGAEPYYTVSVPVKIKLFAYDSMSADSVYAWHGNRGLTKAIPKSDATTRENVPQMLWGSLSTQGEQMGAVSARIFQPSWKEEAYTFIYFDTPSAWETASDFAYSFKWKEAIEVWMKLLDTDNSMRLSCAEYNIATACYMMGENELALKWLDRSDAEYPISLSSGLRSRIKARIK